MDADRLWVADGIEAVHASGRSARSAAVAQTLDFAARQPLLRPSTSDSLDCHSPVCALECPRVHQQRGSISDAATLSSRCPELPGLGRSGQSVAVAVAAVCGICGSDAGMPSLFVAAMHPVSDGLGPVPSNLLLAQQAGVCKLLLPGDWGSVLLSGSKPVKAGLFCCMRRGNIARLGVVSSSCNILGTPPPRTFFLCLQVWGSAMIRARSAMVATATACFLLRKSSITPLLSRVFVLGRHCAGHPVCARLLPPCVL